MWVFTPPLFLRNLVHQNIDRHKSTVVKSKAQTFPFISKLLLPSFPLTTFTCWNQLLALMFGQLCNRESLRDLVVALDAHHSKCYHLGMGRNVSKLSLYRANQNRDYRIFEEYAYFLVREAEQKRKIDIFKLEGNVYTFDSTTIDLCLAVFQWAKFRKRKGGVKFHVLYDVETQMPTFFHITEASVHDSKAMKEIPYEVRVLLYI